MRDQTVSFAELTRGMAACVREWLLPHLGDAMARAQAEELARLLDALPVRYGAAAAANLAADNAAARALLTALGAGDAAPAPAPAPGADAGAPAARDARAGATPPAAGAPDPTAIDALMAENRVLVGRLEALAAAARTAGDAGGLRLLREFFLDRLPREAASTGAQPDFAAMTAAEAAARRS